MTPIDLYTETEFAYPHIFNNREEWLEKRVKGIGGSDASAFINMNPYKSSQELWREKKGITTPKDISNEATERGTKLEPLIRQMFEIYHPELQVQYRENAIFQSKNKDTLFQLYSPDGLLYSDTLGKGILEIKTSKIQNGKMLEQWKDQVPNHYYIQVLHGLLVLNFDFVYIVAQLDLAWNNERITKEHFFTREEVQEDLDYLKQQEIQNWNEFYAGNKEPAIVLNL